VRISILSIVTLFIFYMCAQENSIKITKPQAAQAFSLALVYENETMREDASLLQKMLASTGVFDVSCVCGSMPVCRKNIIDYMHKGFSAILFIQAHKDHISWRLYDTTQAEMLLGKTTGSSSRELTARLVADAVYMHLFNHESYFLTKIAYIKKSPTARNKKGTELALLDPADGTSRTILKDTRTLVAPQWSRGKQGKKIWLSVSEFTPSNVRLLGTDLQGHTWSIIDNEGTYVGTAQQDDATFVYVRSGVLWLYTFDKITKKGKHTRLTKKGQICGCPSLLQSGDIVYSCQGKIYRYDRQTQTNNLLPISGNCLAPDAHAPSNRIIFSRSVNGVLQLHSVDAQGNNLKQITHGPGNKVDACWSPCGNYIAYTRCAQNQEQIALFNCLNGVERILTPEHQLCGYPSWSASDMSLYAFN